MVYVLLHCMGEERPITSCYYYYYHYHYHNEY